jgi:hypothetical protein
METANKTTKLLLTLLIIVTPLLFTSAFLYLSSPSVWPDEAIYVDTAKELLNSGTIRTNIVNGAIYGLEKLAAWYPPIFFYLLAAWIKFFGSAIETVRLLPLSLGIISLITFYFLLKTITKNSIVAIGGTLLLSIDAFFGLAARIARMDMLTYLLNLIAIAFFLTLRKKSTKWLLVPGTFAAISTVTHPFGLIPVVVVSLSILIENIVLYKNSKIKLVEVIVITSKKLFYFTVPVIISVSLWLISLRGNLELFIIQNQLQFLRKKQLLPYLFQLFSANNYFRYLIFLYILINISILFLYIKTKKFAFLFSVVGFAVSLFAILWGKEMWYLLYLQPFTALGIVLIFKHYQFSDKLSYIFAYFPVVLFFLIHILISVSLINDVTVNTKNYNLFATQISRQIPNNSKVFISSIPDPYFKLQERKDLTLYEFTTVPIKDQQNQKLLNSSDYIIYNVSFNPQIPKYIKHNSDKQYVINNVGGYSAIIIKLVSKDQRK